MNMIEILVSEFDFKKNGGKCFAQDCFSNSTKAVKLKEADLMKQTDKELAYIEICKDHVPLIGKVVERINKETYGDFKLIKSEIRDKLK